MRGKGGKYMFSQNKEWQNILFGPQMQLTIQKNWNLWFDSVAVMWTVTIFLLENLYILPLIFQLNVSEYYFLLDIICLQR